MKRRNGSAVLHTPDDSLHHLNLRLKPAILHNEWSPPRPIQIHSYQIEVAYEYCHSKKPSYSYQLIGATQCFKWSQSASDQHIMVSQCRYMIC